jgi:hypothetical protein
VGWDIHKAPASPKSPAQATSAVHRAALVLHRAAIHDSSPPIAGITISQVKIIAFSFQE